MLNSNPSWVCWLTLGIISGAGPQADALLYQKVIEQCQRLYGCKEYL